MRRLAVILGTAVALASCRSTTIVPEPGKITLEDAMKSVGAGLVAMHSAEGNLRTGLVPSEVTVTFNISASATDAEKLYVEVGAPAAAPVTGKAGGEVSTTSTSTRGNQITIKFSNLLFAGDDFLIKSKTGDDIKKLFEALNAAGVVFYMQPRPTVEPGKSEPKK